MSQVAGKPIPLLPPATAKLRTMQALLAQYARENPAYSDERVYVAARMQSEWVYPIAEQMRGLKPDKADDPMRHGLRPFSAADAAREFRERQR
jgi:hypothetical protein